MYKMNALKTLTFFGRKNFLIRTLLKRYSTETDLTVSTDLFERRNYLFAKEQKRQLEEIGRVEKITVEVTTPFENIMMVMNEGISTPYDCAKHVSKGFCQQTPLALVNNEILWDMHRPLPGNCTVRFLNFKDEDTYSLNQVFWRTGSFILGAVISKAFKEENRVQLHSFPPPKVKSGSFAYDVKMNIVHWVPKPEELKVLSAEFLAFVHQNLEIERLQVKKSVAHEIFEGSPVKQSQISSIADKSEDNMVTIYKVGDHVDMSCGPMVANTSFFGRSAVCAVHEVALKEETLYRFQAVALPKGFMLNHFAFNLICQRAEHLNRTGLPDFENHSDIIAEDKITVFPEVRRNNPYIR